ncbi:MBL fold metallo-hydrolase [uncultured Thalassolituus sp.]|uniref:MBL fold metallo-hydrolase n=1 Tax=uncultured Thalassolituus sp. TaxID=285273 RepID=UPI002633F31A|nr:MBL fold metallo-hydrolase [uncultured Thalassolituus sp.]
MARLTFLGAVEGVTGSMYLLETQRSNVLLDCGLFQGRKEEEAENLTPLDFDVSSIDAVVLSHAHLDHSGRLPLLVKEGYQGQIFMTQPTKELISILLKDAASLQERDVEWENKRRRRSGKEPIEPLYGLDKVDDTLMLCEGVDYYRTLQIAPDVHVTFHDAGHILGSSIVCLAISEEGQEKRLVFSGDLGNSQAALLRDPDIISEADVLLMESTYGDRNHKSMEDTLQEFEGVIEEASRNGGNILIPSFAVGRTQEIIFRLGELYQKGKLPHQAIYLDSPMAISVTQVYESHQEVYSDEDLEIIDSTTPRKPSAPKNLQSLLPPLRFTSTTDESMKLNKIKSGAIIIAGSGMCNGGRIRHHLKHNLWRSQSHVVFVGFQAMGTPGRRIIDGATSVKMAGEDIVVKAQIHTLGGFSAHACQSQLLDWLDHFKESQPQLFLVHGESEAKRALKSAAESRGWTARIPEKRETISF